MATSVLAQRCLVVPRITARPRLAAAILIVSDLVAFASAWIVAAVGRQAFGGDFSLGLHLGLWPALPVFVGLFAGRGLYQADGASPVEEVRRVTSSTSIIFVNLIVLTFLGKHAQDYSRALLLAAWALSTVFLLGGRTLLRATLRRREWWGRPAILFGSPQNAAAILRTLEDHSSSGIRIVGVLTDRRGPSEIEGVPVLGGSEMAPMVADRMGVRTAVVTSPAGDAAALNDTVRRYRKYFPQLLVIPDLQGASDQCVETKGIGAFLALEVRQNLLYRWPCLIKRAFDLSMAIMFGLSALPLLIVLALLVKLTSRGPLFYGQLRVGRGKQRFKAWKFRTMVADADRVLPDYLRTHPELLSAWNRHRKLKDDPRVTVVGRFLRQWSLDELPQLWNVIRGDMSLVGPRPIPIDEIPLYGSQLAEYARVLPGITGLWQVSGRSDISYQQRMELDSYYARNWSPWFDLYLLAQTFEAVCNRRGAY